MYSNLTDRARKVMDLAEQETKLNNRRYGSPEDILLGLLKEGTNNAARVLNNFGVDYIKVRMGLAELLEDHQGEVG